MEEQQNFEPQQEQQIFNTYNEGLNNFRNKVQAIRNEISKIIVGQQNMVDLLLAGILANGHVLIEGVPGVAKTLTSKLVARTINVTFSRIQFTPDLMPSDVIGTPVFNPQSSSFEFKAGPVFGNIVLIDEINRAPAKTQSSLFEVMEERQITVDGRTYQMQPPFIVIATQNPVEQEGTYRLPEAQLDRFLFKITVPYPSMDEEIVMLKNIQELRGQQAVAHLNSVMNADDIIEMQQVVRNLIAEEKILKYIAQIVNATRGHRSLSLGASPRASIGLLNAAKAMAALSGRDYIIPDDVITVAKPVLAHRVMLSPEKEMEGISADDVINEIISTIDVPR